MIQIFTKNNYQRYCDTLAAKDKKIETMIKKFGYPIFRERPGGFEGLVRIILEQQVSLASALAVYKKLKSLIDPVTPGHLTRLSDSDLKTCGFSRQKTRYVKILAHEILDNRLNLDALSSLPDDLVRETLLSITGIGSWTCDVYLLFCLNRLDVFPETDLALMNAMVENAFIHEKPSKTDIDKISASFKPLRSIFSMILWHAYIAKRKIKME